VQARSLVHLSDLHFGGGHRLEHRCAELVGALVANRVDHVVVTGDITEHGTSAELERFLVMFEPLSTSQRLTIVPGNHDRLGDDVGDLIMAGRRVLIDRRPGLHLVRVDSTRTNPGWAFVAHGELDDVDLDAIDVAIRQAEPDALVVVLLHHHPVAIPHESRIEALGAALGLPYGEALAAGGELLARLRGRCDLVLHGHRHRPHALELPGVRPLTVYNAGCSPALRSARMFTHAGGRLLAPAQWIGARQPGPAERVTDPRACPA
jgi:3',5'-cyclic-AMP phosphodiesterase